jgi:hypothetical protein
MAEQGMFEFGAVAAGNGVSDLRTSWPIIKRPWGLSAVFETPLDLPQPIGMAVTIEQDGGVPSPTGDKYLVGL